MSFFTRPRARRGVPAALLACLLAGLLLAGCAEDRSNLIPRDTADSLIAKLDEAQALADDNECFKANEVVLEAQLEIENLGPEVDRRLKRSLIAGVTDLQAYLSDSEKCLELEDNSEEPIETEEPQIEDQGATGETGTTEPAAPSEGNQNTDENQDPDTTDGNENGDQPTAPPVTNPTPTPPDTPTDPTTPGGTGPGSGGLGPG